METLDRSHSESEVERRAGSQAEPHLFLILQTDDLRVAPARYRLGSGTSVHIGRGDRAAELSEAGGGRKLQLWLTDSCVSLQHASLSWDGKAWILVDEGSKNGTYVDGRRIDRVMLWDRCLIEIGNTMFVFAHVDAGPSSAGPEVDGAHRTATHGMETLLPRLEHQFADLAHVARSATSVLILGETGTGKEVVASAIHRLSGRSGPFVAVNCGALPPSLLESELFGHRKGAFSGATEARVGWVRSAHGGTLLLDEIGDLPLPAQAALLRVLQQREVVPVGEQRPIPVDLRVCAATHRDLEQLVETGQFRRDLLVRLQGFVFRVPSLRERRVDLGLLIAALLRQLRGRPVEGIRLSVKGFRYLYRYPWPGNIRELEKCLESALALAGAREIEIRHLPEAIRATVQPAAGLPGPTAHTPPTPPPGGELDEGVHAQLTALLHEHRGNVAAVARTLGKHPFQIHRWLKRYGIDLRSFRARSGG